MARSITDARQVTLRQFLQQITNAATYAGTADSKPANQAELDNLLAALNAEVTPLLRMSASSTPDLIVSIGAAALANPESGYSRSIPHIGALLPNNFTSGTVTFPAASGGTITVSPGNNAILTVASGNFIKVLIYMDATGALNVLPGVENAVEASASVLAAPKKTLPLGYVTLQNVAGVIQPIVQTKILQFGAGAGGSSSGSGSGIGDDLNSLTFRADVNDEFEDIPSSTDSAVDISAGKTDSSTYSAANAYYRLAYDASLTVTGTGTAMTLSGTPSFTVKIGDILRVGSEARRITAVGTQTTPTIESAFTTNPTAAAATVSQAVYTKDLNALTVDGLAISTAFSGNISQLMVDYEDTTAADDVIFDANTTPVIAWSASANNSNYTPVSVRPTNLIDDLQIVNLPAAGTNLVVRFFSNKTTGTGFVNILKQKTYFHRDQQYQDGSVLNQAMCFTDGAGTEINCLAPSVVSGKTRVQMTTFTFPVGVNSGTANGSLKVYLNGQKIPRFIDATLTPDASYKEIDQKTIELDGDYSALNMSLEIIQDVAVVDNIDTNTSNITVLQEMNQQAFQGFVNENARLSATVASGAPAAGTFHSTIVNRASIPDLSANLKAQMGVERTMTQAIYQLQDEFGPNGELVFRLLNDEKGLVRFVGSWSTGAAVNGPYVFTATVNDYVEITFYGTGLNLLHTRAQTAGTSWSISTDGSLDSTLVVYPNTVSTILSSRNYSENHIISIASNLTIGIHTVRIKCPNATTGLINISGFEILNESSTIKLNPGSSFINGKKITLNSQQSLTYNSSFESGVLGSRGGRVLVYQKTDGSIAKAVQPAGSQLNLSSADHSNEEVLKVYHPREFGAGRADDFSTLTTISNRAFTLDDGTTTLTCFDMRIDTIANQQVLNWQTNGAFVTFTFVGTGCDYIRQDSTIGGVDTFTVSIDGSAPTTFSTTGVTGAKRIQKIVSGLPYGTHTVRIARSSAPTTYDPTIVAFVVYGPKKPTLPSGAIELADYNVVANYSANSTSGLDTVANGVIRKNGIREFTYINGTGGTADWTIFSGNVAFGYFQPNSDRLNAAMQYTFFGTGFELRFDTGANRSSNISVTLNGLAATVANFPSLVSSVYGTGVAFSAGVLDQLDASSTSGAGLSISGLPLGTYTVKFNNNSAGGYLITNALDIITPIHSVKSNIYGDLQNTLSVGSCAISDNRKTSAIKEIFPAQKAWAQAVGIVSGPSTSSTSLIPMPDMSVTVKTNGGRIRISYSGQFANTNLNNSVAMQIYVNGIGVGSTKVTQAATAGNAQMVSDVLTIPVAAGTHKIDLYWFVDAGSGSNILTRRNLLVEEI